jgi:two-component system LytT family sensor kinase
VDAIWPVLALAAVAVAAGLLLAWLVRHRHDLGTPGDRATFRTLHTASLASPPLRAGLNGSSAEKSVRYLRALLGTPAVALTDLSTVLSWDGAGEHHRADAPALADPVIAEGHTLALGPKQVRCTTGECPLRHCIVAPLTVEDRVVGTLQVYAPSASAGLVRASSEVARWVSGQLELAELDRSRTQLMEAEVRALRAQISPHFIYNSLTAIASFVRTDPSRARELLLEFADFTRYSFRRHGDFTTLADELRSIERYLVLEQARFGDRLDVRLRVAPEVLSVALPFLSLQPLVENAVRHGIEGKSGQGHVSITAEDAGQLAVIHIEDDGVGDDPERVRRSLAGDTSMDSVGLGNVDARLRTVFGDDYGLVVETAPGAGTKVTVRIPKFAPGVRASSTRA